MDGMIGYRKSKTIGWLSR